MIIIGTKFFSIGCMKEDIYGDPQQWKKYGLKMLTY